MDILDFNLQIVHNLCLKPVKITGVFIRFGLLELFVEKVLEALLSVFLDDLGFLEESVLGFGGPLRFFIWGHYKKYIFQHYLYRLARQFPSGHF